VRGAIAAPKAGLDLQDNRQAATSVTRFEPSNSRGAGVRDEIGSHRGCGLFVGSGWLNEQVPRTLTWLRMKTLAYGGAVRDNRVEQVSLWRECSMARDCWRR
jgi:hypothetical protein